MRIQFSPFFILVALFSILYSLFLFPAPSAHAAVRIHMPPNYLRVGASSLVGHWTFDGIDMNWSTNKATDKSGNGKNGTMTNISTTTSPVKGKIGQALNFDGANDYVELGTGLDMNGEMTISLWIKPDTVAAGVLEIVANNNDALGQQDYTFELNRTAAKLSSVWGGTVIITGNTSLSTNTWYHAVLVRSGSSGNWTAKLYLNGAEDNSAATAVNPSATNANTAIGRGGDFDGAYFDGKLDDVRIYNSALSANEVLFLYRAGAARMDIGTSANSALTTGLVGQWTFDGIDMNWSTNKASDKSGSGNSGTLTNMSTTTSPVKGKIGQALNFDGVDDYITTGTGGPPLTGGFASQFNLSQHTFSFWTKLNTVASTNHFFLDLPISGNNLRGYVWWTSNNQYGLGTNKLVTGWYTGTIYTDITFDWTPSANRWYFVTVTYDGTTVSAYVDGVLSGTNDPATTPVSADAAVILGRQNGGGASPYLLNGLIDDVRIYNRALSAAEILQLYQLGQAKANASQNSSMTSGLVGLWSFNGGDMNWSTNKALDKSGNGNDGTLVSMSTTTSSVKGKVGQALTFDGTDDYIDIGNVSTYNFTSSNFSVAFWIYRMEIAASVSDMLFGRGVSEQEGWGISMCNCDQAMAFTSYQAGATQYVQITNGPRLNEWDHAVFVRSGSVGKWYINGVEATLGLNDAIVNPVSSTQNLYVAYGNFVGAGYPKVKLDEVRIYNRALSASEALQLYNMGK